MAVSSISVNITRIAGTDSFNFAVLVNPTAATGGSAMTDGAASAKGVHQGMATATQSIKNVLQANFE